MKKVRFTFLIAMVLTFGIILGFSVNDRKPLDSSSTSSKSSSNTTVKNSTGLIQDNNGTPNQNFGSPYYIDHFDGANDTTSLKSRGYKVYRNGTFTGTPASIWNDGANFPPQAGANFVSSNFASAGDLGNIDNWLVLPKKNTVTGDTLFFWSRSITGSPYPDSIRVMYSAAGDSTPAAAWTEIGRFEVTTSGSWERRGFRAPSAGSGARFAIRYSVVDGGLDGDNSDYIGIDELTIEAPSIPADVGVQSVNAPVGNRTLPATITPNATIKNFGTSAQTFNVTMTISAGGYSSTQTVTGLAGGATRLVNFTGNSLTAGAHTVKVYTQLGSDGNRLNDTITTSYNGYNANFGGAGTFNVGSYFFANSTPASSGAASQPGYCRMDTTGSTSLIVNGIATASFSAGDLDDGHFLVYQAGGPTKKVKFGGVEYDSVFIGTNGIICFTNFVPALGNFNPPANGLPGNGSGGVSRPGVYPLWNDLDFDNAAQPFNRLSYKVDAAKNQLIITYDRAPLFGGADTDYVTMQVVIELVSIGGINSNITINLSNETTNFNLPALVGIQNATGSVWAQYFFANASGAIITAGPVPILDTTLAGGVSIVYGPNASNLIGSCKELRLRTLVEGYWNGTNIPDTMKVEVRSSVSPYNILDLKYAVSDGAGIYSVDVSNVSNSVSYYLVTRNRNSIETWSKLPQTWSSSLLVYDFTTAATQAFGNNQTFKAGKWTIYSGDVNQDGIVDASDASAVDNDAYNFVSGYVQTDVNGDNIIDGGDGAIVDNNATNFISVQRP